MASFTLPSYLSAPNNSLQVSATFPNTSHHLSFSSSLSASHLSLQVPVLSQPAPTNNTLNKSDILADDHFGFHPSERPRSLKAVRKVRDTLKYKDAGKSQKDAYNRAVQKLMEENTVVMEDLKDYDVVNFFIKEGVWVPDFMIHETTNKKFRRTLEKRKMVLGNKLRREKENVMKQH